ncbi:MAG: hypothetical protein QM532_02245 [Cyanobium sp. MAG06]|nr:hypothetical protein [Cyanobium sp. MAG06]
MSKIYKYKQKIFTICLVILTLSFVNTYTVLSLYSNNIIFSPPSENMNTFDKMSLTLYCKLSEIFTKNNKKCFIDLSRINKNDTIYKDIEDIKNNLLNITSNNKYIEEKINNFNNATSTNNNLTVIKYVNGPAPIKRSDLQNILLTGPFINKILLYASSTIGISSIFINGEKDIKEGDIVTIQNIDNIPTLYKSRVGDTVLGVVANVSDNKSVVILTGKVTVNSDIVNGEIKAGDYVSISNINTGVVSKLLFDDYMVGLAMENSNNGTVNILLRQGIINRNNISNSSINTISSNIYSTSSTSTDKNNSPICIDDICINKSIMNKIIQYFR